MEKHTNQKWISASDRIPDVADDVVGWDGHRALIVWHDGTYNKCGLLEWHFSFLQQEWYLRDEVRDNNRDTCTSITHWIPIPWKPV